MGAQTEKRRQMFIQRYEEVENIEGEGLYSALYCIFFFSFFFAIYCTFYSVHFYSVGDLSARCHYCTHYSSAIIVASFLVRMEPFSHTFQTLQVRPWAPGSAMQYMWTLKSWLVFFYVLRMDKLV